MRRLQILACLWGVVGCTGQSLSQGPEQTSTVTKSDVLNIDVEVEKALENRDYRLFLTQGRRPVSPGLEHIPIEKLKAHCGTKFLAGTGDVLKSAEEKKARVEKYNFAKAYNRKMYALCQKMIGRK
ncbi:hypothetical protein L1286_09005 [Pseudoalteromonas sp. SMS1]|uniref:hypothetical protein n=1 Tax=Pseudoalteromonas sp. SMS1 TaxID=2908894 RepID=UPI001F433B2C|nr:hypothetical protein [Pseudoalteromonas sp. SMS1]MCF2857607.1 hypothetical protein [Pseudoalteromonas sp. SMS1]